VAAACRGDRPAPRIVARRGWRFARRPICVDAYVDFVREHTFLEAVASSLTEMFAGSLITLRLDALRHHYPWMAGGLDYFETAPDPGPQDARFALDWVQRNAHSPEDQELACALSKPSATFLWAQLDALYFAYVEPGWPAPGAFIRR